MLESSFSISLVLWKVLVKDGAVVAKLYLVCGSSFPCKLYTDIFSAAKTADLILIMLDATKSDEQKRLLEIELDAVGIRLNKSKPDVVYKRKTTGGVVKSTL